MKENENNKIKQTFKNMNRQYDFKIFLYSKKIIANLTKKSEGIIQSNPFVQDDKEKQKQAKNTKKKALLSTTTTTDTEHPPKMSAKAKKLEALRVRKGNAKSKTKNKDELSPEAKPKTPKKYSLKVISLETSNSSPMAEVDISSIPKLKDSKINIPLSFPNPKGHRRLTPLKLKTGKEAVSPNDGPAPLSVVPNDRQAALISDLQAAFAKESDRIQKETKVDQGKEFEINVDKLIQSVLEADTYAQREASGKNLILVIGNTGAGKSTFVNYLAGCQMKLKELAASLIKGVIAENPIVEIGHGFPSHTSKPQIYFDERTGFSYCDCPGFFDNRGPIFDVTNAYSIKSITTHAKSVKAVIVIIDYHSLLADRSKGLMDTVHLMNLLFGRDVISHKDSILLLITKVPVSGDDVFTIEELKECIQAGNDSVINQLLENVCFYDPLDRACNYGAFSRGALIERILSSPLILGTGQVFSLSLSGDAKLALGEFIRSLGVGIDELIDTGKYREISRKIDTLERLGVLDFAPLSDTKQTVHQIVSDAIQTLQAENGSLNTLTKIKAEIPHFSKNAAAAIKVIEERMEAEKQIEAQRQRELAAAGQHHVYPSHSSHGSGCMVM